MSLWGTAGQQFLPSPAQNWIGLRADCYAMAGSRGSGGCLGEGVERREVPGVFGQNLAEMPLAEDQHAVQALAA